MPNWSPRLVRGVPGEADAARRHHVRAHRNLPGEEDRIVYHPGLRRAVVVDLPALLR